MNNIGETVYKGVVLVVAGYCALAFVTKIRELVAIKKAKKDLEEP